MQQPANQGRGFDVGEAIAVGWRRFWPNILPMAVYGLIVWAVSFLTSLPQTDGFFGQTLNSIISFAIGQLIAIGWIAIALDIVDGKPINAESVTARFKLFVPYAIAALIFSIALAIGFVLLIVPGIIVLIVFGFYGYYIIDTGEKDPIAALRSSMELTRGHRGTIFVLGLLLLLINIVGVLAFVIGLLFTSGISLIAIAYAYRQMAPAAGSVPPPPATGGPTF